MKVRARLAWLLAPVLVLAATAGTSTTAAGSPTARTGSSVATVSTVPTVLQSMTVTAPATTLVGAALTTMTVSVHLVDPDGISSRVGASMDRSWDCPCVSLEPVTSAGAPFRASPQSTGIRIVSLTLASGTATDGVWVGSSILGAADAGIWRPSGIDAGDFLSTDQGSFAASLVAIPSDVRAATSLNVRGYDWPLLSVHVPSAVTTVGQRFVVSGSVVTSRSHRPVPGLRVALGAGPLCGPLDHCAGTAVRTSATGTFALSSTDYHQDWNALWAQDGNGFPVSSAADSRRHVRASLTVRAPASRVAAGSAVAVSGHIAPLDGVGRVLLLRFYAGTWHTVASTAGYRGGYRLTAPAARGTWQYRVRLLRGTDCIGAYSSSFTVRGV